MTDRHELLERDIIVLVRALLQSNESNAAVLVEPLVGGTLRPDLVVDRPDRPDLIVEVKLRAPLTRPRINEMVNQLWAYGDAWEREAGSKPELLLVIPFDVLTYETKGTLSRRNISVWDERDFVDQLLNLSDDVLDESTSRSKWLVLGRSRYARPDLAARGREREGFGELLASVSCGRENWARYQRLCADILNYLFCPPLEFPLYETTNESGVNRRDIILPNYATDGFWRFLRETYSAEYVVVDSKNLCGAIDKNHVLQLANYLTQAGTGMFGLILSRHGNKRAAEITRREQWLVNRKMILTLTDNDLHQMIASKQAGSPPEEVVRQKLQDFRLSI